MPTPEELTVLDANARFYDAFEHRDIDRMSDVWYHDDSACCVHPGWPALRGWAAISASWTALFSGPQRLQFIITNESVAVTGEMAWVTCDENLLDGAAAQAVAATNIFRLRDSEWLMVVHHASAVLTRSG